MHPIQHRLFSYLEENANTKQRCMRLVQTPSKTKELSHVITQIFHEYRLKKNFFEHNYFASLKNSCSYHHHFAIREQAPHPFSISILFFIHHFSHAPLDLLLLYDLHKIPADPFASLLLSLLLKNCETKIHAIYPDHNFLSLPKDKRRNFLLLQSWKEQRYDPHHEKFSHILHIANNVHTLYTKFLDTSTWFGTLNSAYYPHGHGALYFKNIRLFTHSSQFDSSRLIYYPYISPHYIKTITCINNILKTTLHAFNATTKYSYYNNREKNNTSTNTLSKKQKKENTLFCTLLLNSCVYAERVSTEVAYNYYITYLQKYIHSLPNTKKAPFIKVYSIIKDYQPLSCFTLSASMKKLYAFNAFDHFMLLSANPLCKDTKQQTINIYDSESSFTTQQIRPCKAPTRYTLSLSRADVPKFLQYTLSLANTTFTNTKEYLALHHQIMNFNTNGIKFGRPQCTQKSGSCVLDSFNSLLKDHLSDKDFHMFRTFQFYRAAQVLRKEKLYYDAAISEHKFKRRVEKLRQKGVEKIPFHNWISLFTQ